MEERVVSVQATTDEDGRTGLRIVLAREGFPSPKPLLEEAAAAAGAAGFRWRGGSERWCDAVRTGDGEGGGAFEREVWLFTRKRTH